MDEWQENCDEWVSKSELYVKDRGGWMYTGP